MPLDPEKLKEANERAQSLSKRFDAFVERHKSDPDEDEDDDPDEEDLEEAAKKATEASSQPEV
jgi:hypothetical protein